MGKKIKRVNQQIQDKEEEITKVEQKIATAKGEWEKGGQDKGHWQKLWLLYETEKGRLQDEKGRLQELLLRITPPAEAGPLTSGARGQGQLQGDPLHGAKGTTGRELVRRASAVANDVVVLGQKRPITELFELGWHQRLLPSEDPLSHDNRYQLVPGQDKVTACLERDWFKGVYDEIVKHLNDPAAQRWMEIAGPSGIGKSNGLVSIADRLLIWAAQQREAGQCVRIFPILNAESLTGKETWRAGVQAALGAGFHDDKVALATIPQLDSPRAVSDFVLSETKSACWLIDQAHGLFQNKEALDQVKSMTSLQHAVFVSSGGGTRASEHHARHCTVDTLPIPTEISQVDIENWDLRYRVPFTESAARRRLDMLASNLLLRFTFWQSCKEVGVSLPPLSDDVMKTRVQERPSKQQRLTSGEVEGTSKVALLGITTPGHGREGKAASLEAGHHPEEAKGPEAAATGGASGSKSGEPVSFHAAWAHFLKSKAMQALFSDLMGTLQNYMLEAEMVGYVKEKCKELALATTWVNLKPGVFSGRDFLFMHSGSELLLKAQAASGVVRFALAQAAEAAVSYELAFTGCMGKLVQELGRPEPHPALVGILAERVVGERLQQGAGQAYFDVIKAQMLRVRKYKQDQVESLASDLLEEALKVLSVGKEEQHVTLAVPDEFNARDTDFHVIVIQKLGTKGAASAPGQKPPQVAADPGPSSSTHRYAGLSMRVHGIQVTTSDLLRHANSEDHAMHPQRASRWRANVLGKEQVKFSFLFVAPEGRLGPLRIDEEVPEGHRKLGNGAKVIQVAHRQVLLPFGVFDDKLAMLDQWPKAWVDSIEGTWAVTEEVERLLGDKFEGQG